MDKLIVEGGRPLYGSVAISGAKNAALPLLAATLLAPGLHTLHNVPDLRDTRTMLKLLEILGVQWERTGKTVRINSDRLTGVEAPYDLVKTMRASVLVLGPLLARSGFARVSLPGGCAIGARPINYHLKGFEKLGVTTHLEHGYVEAIVEGRMRGGTVYFDIPSVTGTENVLMASVVAQGESVIKNAAKEPEVGNLIDMLTAMGAEIEGKGTDRLIVRGVDRLHATESTIIPDRIETGTYMIAVAATGGSVTITDCNPAHLPALTEKLLLCGVNIDTATDSMTVSCPEVGGRSLCRLQSVDITTLPYPGFPTDLQAQFMALMAQGEGTSIIHETIFENRFMHVAELIRMGADITIEGSRAVIRGVGRDKLCGAPVMATDLRASASLVIAGLSASGTTQISRIYHLERGYENMVEKLQGLGAKVWKVRE
ncbi:UDP-N-acetylglucosamine 1-carboxyvinyltransferase [uncultured Desulfobulbus sp.]|uniref:UDP-N-acetylglucosamine 1-carboxyvinyltransferase n=1 Tax=uncultured Desulfobulbus sp. TaxID=239745 RepID=UPI0029C8CC65|nr:UDP-N-acetylglucosamine 1-carboxyvinyltransferase [uncultured Desulfobulbus sp.]